MAAKNAAARPLIAWARNLGCEVTYSHGHWKVTHKGRYVATVASTPSCPRSLKNSRAQIRRSLKALKTERAAGN